MVPVEKNKEYELKIESVTSEGMGVSHIDGFCVFVAKTAPEDVVLAHILKVNKGYAYAKISKIITPSPYRVTPPCQSFSACGGCQLMHIDYDQQLKIKKNIIEDALFRIGKLNIKVDEMIGADSHFRYRNKMIFPVGTDKSGKKICGFYKVRSHEIVPLEDCLLGDEINSEIIKRVMDFIEKYKISVYNEEQHKGLIRRLFIRYGYHSKEIMVVLSVNAKTLPHYDEFAKIIKDISPRIKSVVLNFNTKKTNVCLGDTNALLFGNETINDTLCQMEYEISPHSFFQINPVQTQKLYNKAITLADIKKTDVVMDLYCGIGTISLCASRFSKKVIGVEIVEQAILDARKNAEKNSVDNVEFYASDVSVLVPKLICNGERPDVVILDPPRKGSDNKTLSSIITAEPKKIVYISCNPSTLARDLNFLCENGYEVKNLVGVDMFPQTMHIECCVLLSLEENQK